MQFMQVITSLLLAAFAGYIGAWYFGALEGNFALLLFLATVVTGVYWLGERFYFLPQRRKAAQALEDAAVERRAELEVIPACLEYGTALIAWSPLAGGLLAGRSDDPDGRRHSDGIKAAAAARSKQLARFDTLCADLRQSPGAVALAWLLRQAGVAAAIIGPRSLEQLSSVLHVPDLHLSDETMAAIDAIFPACGPAPEAYAW